MAKTQTETDQLIMLDPAKIDATAPNAVRFSVLPSSIEALKAAIVAQGRVNDPVEVAPLLDGKKATGRYSLTVGFGRHAAVTALNKEGAGLLLPAIVRTQTDEKARIARQLSENVDRKSLSPMDQAVAIQNLLATGYSKPEVRQLFSRPGGRKGLALQPASNAWLNMTLSFLELPKDVQAKIHDGRVGVAAAYELTRVSPEKRATVIERAEANRVAEQEREEKLDEKLAKAEAKAAKKAGNGDANAKRLAEAEAKLNEAEVTTQQAAEAREALEAELKGIGKMSVAEFQALAPEQKKAEGEKIAAAKANLRGAEVAHGKAKRELDKAQRKVKAVAEAIEGKAKAKAETAPKTKTAAKAPEKKKEAVGPRDVKKAAAEVGAGAAQPLNQAEMRKAAASLAGSKYKQARAIGNALLDCFNGKLSAGSLVTAVEVATGERKTAKA